MYFSNNEKSDLSNYAPGGYYSEPSPKNTASYQVSGLYDAFIIPALKSLFIGLFTGIFAGLVVWVFRLPFSGWQVWLLVWFGVTAFSFWRFSAWATWLIERVTGADLNGDGIIGAPVQALPEPQKVRVEVVQDQGHAVDYIDLPASPEKLRILAAGLTGGRSFNQTAWVGSGGLFSRSEFDQLRDTMIQRGLLAWKNPSAKAQGCELTAAGRAVMKHIAVPLPHSNGAEDR